MKDLEQVVSLVLIPILPSLAILLGLYIQKATVKAKAELAVANESIVAKRLDQAAQAVADAVHFAAQTYVDAMKGKDAFDEVSQAAALKIAKDRAVLLMSDAARSTVTNVSGDLDAWLHTKIEAKINELKTEPIIVDHENAVTISE